ncbi:MAG: nitroreductase family protein [Candidatus Thermoplasmatota archaeon]|nr:nitroreductase family protein [Candidatus Thermoplasmatota archaeon]
MDVFEAIRGRRSVRAYRDKEVSEDLVDRIFSAAVMAPSAGNLQAWEFVVVRDQKRKEELAQAALDQGFIASAPLVIAVCANRTRSAQRYGARGADLYCIQDCAVATQNLLLAAYDLRLGTCWVGAFDEAAVSQILQIPNDVRPMALIPLGYPAERPDSPSRLPLERVLHFERY